MKKLVIFVVVFPAVGLLSLRAGAVVAGLPTIGSFFNGVDPLTVVITLAAGFAVTAYLLGALSHDYSWVDRLWSTAPVAFAWVYAVRADLAPVVSVAALLVTLWGARLTFNFARRGGYTTIEDYRWPILRQRIASPLLWQLFNLLFISGFQVGLFVLFTLPLARLAAAAPVAYGIELPVFALLFLVFLAWETGADQQQWTFQSIKHGQLPADPPPRWLGPDDTSRRQALEADLERGFLTHGLFRYSRHPNYFGELAVWWTLYLLASAVTGDLVNWSGLGALVLTALFAGSTRFTESISLERYPEYAEYRSTTSAVVPWVPGLPAGQEQVD